MGYHCFHHTMVSEVNDLNTTSYDINRLLPIVQGMRVLEFGRFVLMAFLIFVGGGSGYVALGCSSFPVSCAWPFLP